MKFVRIDPFDRAAVPARYGESRWKPARYIAFTQAAGDPDKVQMVDLGEAGPIDRLIRDFRATITGGAEQDASRDMVKPKALRVPTDVVVQAATARPCSIRSQAQLLVAKELSLHPMATSRSCLSRFSQPTMAVA